MSFKYDFLEQHKFTPTNHQEFWCSICDAKVVDSSNTKTGHFFSMFGHVRRVMGGKNIKEGIGNYEQFLFAICDDCLSKTHAQIFPDME